MSDDANCLAGTSPSLRHLVGPRGDSGGGGGGAAQCLTAGSDGPRRGTAEAGFGDTIGEQRTDEFIGARGHSPRTTDRPDDRRRGSCAPRRRSQMTMARDTILAA
jgi:hypothetical protein